MDAGLGAESWEQRRKEGKGRSRGGWRSRRRGGSGWKDEGGREDGIETDIIATIIKAA